MKLHSAFQTEPTLVQLAKQGAWEEAWSFSSSDIPDPAQLRRYLGMAEEVAIEAFFGRAFIGVRLSAETSELAQLVDAILGCLRGTKNGDNYIADLRNMGCLKKEAACAPHVEIGAVNAWRSVGAVRLSDPQSALAQLDARWPLLQQSAIGRDMLHPKAVEFAFLEPTHHWIALPVSDGRIPFSLSKEMLYRALQWGADFFG